MDKNGVKYLKDTNISKLTLHEKTKNLGGATPDLVISQPLSSRIQTYVRKFNPAIHMLNLLKWLY
jgi:hypothetical protein